MRSSFAVGRGSLLIKTPNARQLASRRRMMVIASLLGLALVSGLAGSLIAARTPPLNAAPGPFSYFPSE